MVEMGYPNVGPVGADYEEVVEVSAEDKAMYARRMERSNRSSSLISEKLLQGWTMLNEYCPADGCGTVLMGNKNKQMWCVNCSNWVVREEDLSDAQRAELRGNSAQGGARPVPVRAAPEAVAAAAEPGAAAQPPRAAAAASRPSSATGTPRRTPAAPRSGATPSRSPSASSLAANAPLRNLSGAVVGEVAAELEKSMGSIKDRMSQARMDFDEAGLAGDVEGSMQHLELMNALANAMVVHLRGLDQLSLS